MRRHTHLITPGDHYSPKTGSAIPTVVHGLSGATAPTAPPPAVLVARGTYPDRYPSAEAIEYTLRASRTLDRYIDPVLGMAGFPRPGARRALRPAFADQLTWAPSVVLAHNLPQAIPLIDPTHHIPVLYAHNHLLRTYTPREASRVLGAAAAIVCVSSSLADMTAQQLPIALRDRVVVVPNGVDASAYEARPRLRRDRLHVVFVGRTIRDKGPDVLIEAVVRLGRPDIELVIVGSTGFAADAPLSAYERDLRSAAAQPGARVTFRPFLDRAEVRTVMEAADVVVVPSRWQEPFGLTVLEGMAAGAAVIASEVGGIPETAGGSAILVPPADPVALAAAIEALADDRDLLTRTAHEGRRHAERSSWEASLRRLDETLGTILT